MRVSYQFVGGRNRAGAASTGIAAATAAVTGTAAVGINETDIVAGGKTIIITLTGNTWVASGATFNAQRLAIIQGLDSAQSEATGWNNEVRDQEVAGAVVRTSNTVVTITLSAQAAYNITSSEVITVTVPSSAITSGGPLTATPNFGISVDSGFATPDLLLEDWSTYTSTADLKSGGHGIYSDPLWLGDGNESSNTTQIVLDQTTGVPAYSLTQSMRYDFPANPGAEYTIGCNLVLPANETEIWLEVWAKFSSNFNTLGNTAENPDYKFIFGRCFSSRFNLMMGTGGSGFTIGYPSNEDNEYSGADAYFDGQWHAYRFHFKTGGSGTTKFWVDSTLIHDFGTVSVTATSMYGIALGRNQNRNITNSQQLWFGRVGVWSFDPGF